MLTIFTPTYNRAYILPRLYKSLVKQSNKNFEWVIVDDGSNDNTKDLVDRWINQNKIPIRYYYQENQGKPMAHNYGVEEAKGEIFTCVDSDDYITENAVEIIFKKYNEIKNNDQCVGIAGMCIFENKKPVGTYMPEKIEFTRLSDLYSKHKYKGDTILIYKSKIIKKYKFPQIQGEKFMPETYLYDKIDQDGELAIIKDGIYVCEYLNDGYTKNSKKLIKNNPKGYRLCAEQRLIISKNIKQKYIAASKYVLGSILANEKHYIKNSPNKTLSVLGMPCALFIYWKNYRNIKE